MFLARGEAPRGEIGRSLRRSASRHLGAPTNALAALSSSNAAAGRVLGDSDALDIVDGKLAARATGQRLALDDLLWCAVRTGMGHAADAGGVLALRNGDGIARATFAVEPLRLAHIGQDIGPQPVRAAVSVREACASGAVSEDALRLTFGLSSAEARLAVHLANGLRLHEIARLNGVAEATIRSQLKSIFNKTRAHRQAELVRIVLASIRKEAAPAPRGP